MIEQANAVWCQAVGFSAQMVKGSHGLSLLKGPKTEEDLVQSIWGKQEKSVTVIHYTAGGSMVNHTIRVTPLMAEDSNTVTHYLMISSFEKYIGTGNFFDKAKAVINTNKFAGRDKEKLAPSLETPGSAQPQERVKSVHHLKKENALKKLELYADTMRQSVTTKVPLTQILRTQSMPKAGVDTTESKEQAATADCINSSPPPHTPLFAIYLLCLLLRCCACGVYCIKSMQFTKAVYTLSFSSWKTRFAAAKRQAKRTKSKSPAGFLGAGSVWDNSGAGNFGAGDGAADASTPSRPATGEVSFDTTPHALDGVSQAAYGVSKEGYGGRDGQDVLIACIKAPLTKTPLTHHPQSEVAILVSTLLVQVHSTSDSEVVNSDSGGGGV